MKVLTLLIYLEIIVNIDSSKVTDMTALITKTLYESNFVTSVVWWRDNADVTDFLKSYKGSFVVVSISKNRSRNILKINQSVGYNQTVFFATAPEQFAYWVRLINKNIVTPIRVILAITKAIVHIDELAKYTRTAWKYDVSDIVIISANENRKNVTLWTYFPYSDGKCGDHTPIELRFSLDATKLFPKKFSNFYKCPIKVNALHYPPYTNITYENDTITDITGIEGNGSMVLLKTLNATMEIVSVTWHSGFSSNRNSSSSGTFQVLQTRKADMSVPCGLLSYKRYTVSQMSPVLQTAKIKWVGPNRREIYEWARVLLPFYTSLTPFLCLTFFIFTAVTTLVKRLKTDSKSSVAFQSFAIFLGQEVNFMTRSSATNSLFFLWVWFTMIVRIGYQGDLVDGLQKVILEPPLGQLQEALKQVNGFGGVEVFRDYYSEASLRNHYTVLQFHELNDYIKAIYEGKRFILIVDYILVAINNIKLQTLNEISSHFLGCTYMRPAWPASREINGRIQQVVENGILGKVGADYEHQWKVQYKYSESGNQVLNALGMPTLAALFYGLAAGWLVCFVIFIAEISYFNYTQNKRPNRHTYS